MKTLEECKDELNIISFKSHPSMEKEDSVEIDEAIRIIQEYAQSIRDHYEAKLKEKDAEIERLKGQDFKDCYIRNNIGCHCNTECGYNKF